MFKRYFWSKKDGTFGKEFPVSEAPIPGGTSSYSSGKGSLQGGPIDGGPIPTGGRPIYSSSEVQISIINSQGVVKRIRDISDSQTNPDSEGSDELDGKDVEVINPLASHSSGSSPTKPPSKKFHSHLISSTLRNFQPVLSSVSYSVPPPSPKSFTYTPILASPIKQSPILHPRPSPVLTSNQLQPVARTSQRRDDWSPLPFPAAPVFQNWECWPIRVTREYPTVGNEGQASVARLYMLMIE
ncbi:hypothetical protein O181_006465 [Austropuccinia psidii MF-1]|uniref:Uncharacterized protein n=1 Tax=Austropuccinia psidii MF-1 TaxID=1389203 RepID=A0A9Q3GGW2_9BASI|nr:hypothetical protein [Austropuccinia psidii MF-1]